jgi:hypothetical protein
MGQKTLSCAPLIDVESSSLGTSVRDCCQRCRHEPNFGPDMRKCFVDNTTRGHRVVGTYVE